MMTQATEQKLLLRLREFENSTLFTKNISLSYLATYCGANTRYISYIINTYKKKDFNNYINELRIKYIVFKLEKMPQYRKYKVATLAEEAGFLPRINLQQYLKSICFAFPIYKASG